MAFNIQHGPALHDFQAEINYHLRQAGLSMECGRGAEPDGDCFYDSVIAVLEDRAIRRNIAKRAKNIHTIQDLRKAVAHFMDTSKELRSVPLFKAYQVALNNEPESKGLSWKQYLNEVAFTKRYADQLVIMCTAVFLGKDIFIANFPTKSTLFLKPWDKISGQPEGWTEPVTAPPLIIGYLRERHFEPLREIPSTSGEQACRGCGWKGASLIIHLTSAETATTEKCELFYDMQALELQSERCF